MTNTLPGPFRPRPITEFNDSGLAAAIQRAMEGVAPGHGKAILDVQSGKGVGIMVIHRVGASLVLVFADRFDDQGNTIQVAVQKSW